MGLQQILPVIWQLLKRRLENLKYQLSYHAFHFKGQLRGLKAHYKGNSSFMSRKMLAFLIKLDKQARKQNKSIKEQIEFELLNLDLSLRLL